jgi:predicted PurR-regulated permease PerM
MAFGWIDEAQPAPDTPTLRSEPLPRVHRIEITARTMFTLLLVMGACWLLLQLSPVLLVLITSLMLVGSLSPAVEWLQARGVRRGMGIGIVFAILLIVVLVLITLAIPELFAQATSLIEREPKLREELAQQLARRRLTAPMANSLRQINYAAMVGSSTKMAFATSLRVVETVAYGVGAVFLALYIMIDRDRLRGALFALVPRTQHVLLSRVMLNLERIVGGYIRGQVITCALMAVFIFVLLTAFGVKSALALAVVAGVADVLPYIGGILVLGPALLATLGQGLVVTGTVAALILVYQEVESRLLVPWVYGRALRLPSSVVLVALLAGGTLNGVVGALLALPVASALLMLVEELRVELPGRSETPEIEQLRERDEVSELEYASRTEGMPVHEAAAIAVEMADERKREDELAAEPTPEGTAVATDPVE